MKINRKLILLLILVLVTSILSGCNKKAPEGVSQEFYDDMVICITNVKNTDTSKDDGYGNILKYEDVVDTLSQKEQLILESMSDIYIYVGLNKDSDDLFIDDISKSLGVFTRLMDIDIKIDKIKAK